MIIRGNYEQCAGLHLRADGGRSCFDSEFGCACAHDPHQIPDVESWICAHVIDGDVGQAMPRPCSSTYVGGRRSILGARGKNGDAKSPDGSDEATETRRRCAAGAGPAYLTAKNMDGEAGGSNPVEEDEDCSSPAECDDVRDSSIGDREANQDAIAKDQAAIFTPSIRIGDRKASGEANVSYIKKGTIKRGAAYAHYVSLLGNHS